MKNKLKPTGYLALLVLWTSPLFAQGSSQLFVFGDSLSDPGNYFTLFKELEVQPYENKPDSIGAAYVPGSPYAIGGGHFSNGETWVEQLAVMLGDPRSGSPAARAPGTFTNYAVGRSRARNALLEGVFDEVNLDIQVQAFLDDYDGTAPSEATYVLWIGSNDVADALLTANFALIPLALQNIADNITMLHQAGARKFLLATVPNLGSTPRIQQLDAVTPGIADFATAFSGAFNGMLLGAYLPPLGQALSGIQFQILDAFGLLQSVILDPEEYGFEVVDQACIIPDTRGRAQCSKPDTYLFWDGQHPTTAAHGIFADAAYELLTTE